MQKYKYLLSSMLIATSSLAFANNSQHIAESGMDTANMITIQPQTRSAALNAKHAAECAKMGGVDVTDQETIRNGKGVIDAIVCKINNIESYAQYATSNNVKYYKTVNNYRTEVHLINHDLSSGVEVFAPSGVYPSYPDSYHADSLIIFNSSAAGTRYSGDLAVDGDYFYSGNRCFSYLNGGIVPNEGLTYVLGVSCYGAPGKRQSIVNGGAGLDRVVDYGVIVHPSGENEPDAQKNMGVPEVTPSCNMPSSFKGNPINIAVGNKFQQEIDAVDTGVHSLQFLRTYNSTDGVWRHNYSSSLKIKYPSLREITLADGRRIDFNENGGIITASPTELGTLKKVGSGYEYTSPFHEISDFDSAGHLTRTVSNGGIVHNISYPNDRTIVVSDNLKDTLTITENADHQPIEVKTSSGKVVTYEYDAEKRLVKVTKNGKSRKYHYEDTRFPRALTGITDENGIRYVTWTYDDKGRANSSTHADGKDKVSITYNSDTQTTFTNPLNRKYTYNYTVIDGVKRITSISGAASSLCPAIGSSYQYNAHGLVTLRTDGKGIKTSYDYNDAGQEISRTIGVGSPNAVTIKTTWDDRFNLPKTETYPDKVITYSYDADGNVTGQTVKSLN